MILAAVYNFHAFGFFMGLTGLLTSVPQTIWFVKHHKHPRYRQDETRCKYNSKLILWLLYVSVIVFNGLAIVARIFALTRREEWRDELAGNFPLECPLWAERRGCTRISLEEDSCIRPLEILEENSIIFRTYTRRMY